MDFFGGGYGDHLDISSGIKAAQSEFGLLSDLLGKRYDKSGKELTAEEIEELEEIEKRKADREAALASAAAGPGSIGGPGAFGRPSQQQQKEEKKKESKSIWDDEEVAAADAVDIDYDDGRERPEFDILYKQRVGTEDVFLGLDPEKNPSSMGCDTLVVRIKLPGQKFRDVSVDVNPKTLIVMSPDYKLALSLPEVVDENQSRAQWDAVKATLSVTMPVIRE